jgi:putative ABC transport system permease protein
MTTLWHDVRYGVRMLGRSPGFAAVVVLVLALGIGANTAIFTMTHAVLMSPWPFEEPERLVTVQNQWKRSGHQFPVSGPEYLDWTKHNKVFDGLSASTYATFSLTGIAEPLALTGPKVTPGFFHTLGAPPLLGRGFYEEEAETGRHRVAVLSHRLWKTTFGGDPNIVGRQIVLDGAPWTVVGVARPTMGFVEDLAQLYVPLPQADLQTGRSYRYLAVFGRLKPGVSTEQARAQMDLMAAQLARENPSINPDQGIGIRAVQDVVGAALRMAFLVLHGAVALVLLIACANVANLLVARAGGRAREVAVRCALGAGRGRILRQMLTESLLLGLLGGGLGLVLAFWGLGVLQAIAPRVGETGVRLPGFAEIRLDLTVLGFTLSLSVLTAVVFGLVPAWRASHDRFQGALREGGSHASTGLSRRRMLGALVVSQIALALVLLTGSGLLLRSFLRLARVNPGFVPGGLLAVQMERPDTPENRQDATLAAFYQQLVDRLRDLPGVESVGAIDRPPIGSSSSESGFYVREETSGTDRMVMGQYRLVTEDYFQCLKIPLLRGRFFAASDRATEEKVIIVDRRFVERYLPEGEPLGKTVTHWGAVKRIVGVVGDVKLFSLEDRAGEPVVYEPICQKCVRRMTVLLRTLRDPVQLAPAVRRIIWDLDPDQPILRTQTMNQIVGDSASMPRFCMILLLAMGSVALLMAVTGIYAIVAFAVNERKREIGIRLAFGAEQADIRGLVIRRGTRLVAAGLVLGVIGALVLTRCMSSLLFQISPTDPATLLGAALLLAAVALAACYLPARRAARIDPMVALRYE